MTPARVLMVEMLHLAFRMDGDPEEIVRRLFVDEPGGVAFGPTGRDRD